MNTDLAERRVLRQVIEGGITIHGGGYVHGGRPVTGELAEALVRLHTAGCIAVGAARRGGARPVRATAAGKARLAELGRGGRDD